MRTQQNGAATAAPADTSARRWWVLAVVVAGFFMTMLDSAIVNVAIPSSQAGLQAGYVSVEWVVS